MDRYADALFWEGLEYMSGDTTGALPEREAPWGANLLMCRPPRDIAEIRAFWAQAAPDLETLREPFAQHAVVPNGWVGDFDSFAEFLKGWAEVVTEADRRGWGIVGLRC